MSLTKEEMKDKCLFACIIQIQSNNKLVIRNYYMIDFNSLLIKLKAILRERERETNYNRNSKTKFKFWICSPSAQIR